MTQVDQRKIEVGAGTGQEKKSRSGITHLLKSSIYVCAYIHEKLPKKLTIQWLSLKI